MIFLDRQKDILKIALPCTLLPALAVCVICVCRYLSKRKRRREIEHNQNELMEVNLGVKQQGMEYPTTGVPV